MHRAQPMPGTTKPWSLSIRPSTAPPAKNITGCGCATRPASIKTYSLIFRRYDTGAGAAGFPFPFIPGVLRRRPKQQLSGMSNIQIEVDGVVTNLRNKTDLLKVIGDMNKACASKVKSGAVKTNAKK